MLFRRSAKSQLQEKISIKIQLFLFEADKFLKGIGDN